MKKHILIGLLLVGSLAAGHSAIFYQGTTVPGGTSMGAVANPTILDGNPANVLGNSMTLSGLGSSLSSITVSLNISGGYNNGLYLYLVSGATTVTLMNQPGYAIDGFGALGAGMNITLQYGSTDHGAIQSETSGSVLSGTYNAAASLSAFSGVNPNSTWTLYMADTLSGGGNATLNGWSLNITAVPEPATWALIGFGVMFAGAGAVRSWRNRSLAVQ